MEVALNAMPNFSGPSSATLTLVNNTGFPLNGFVSAYVNTGASSLFHSDQFDQLNEATLILPTQSFSLADGEMLPPAGSPPITALLGSDQYLLVLGTVTEGSESIPFAEAFTFVVAEPSTSVLAAIAGAIGLGYAWWRRVRART